MTEIPFNAEKTNYYQEILAQEWFTDENKKIILRMAISEWKRRYSTKPIINKVFIDWVLCDTVDRNVWQENCNIHNLRIIAAQRLIDRIDETMYNYELDYFEVQAKLRDQEVPIACGSHFQDKEYYTTANIL